jgi:hypothetical protein
LSIVDPLSTKNPDTQKRLAIIASRHCTYCGGGVVDATAEFLTKNGNLGSNVTGFSEVSTDVPHVAYVCKRNCGYKK